MIMTVIFISYNKNVICSAKYIGQIHELFTYFSLHHVPAGAKWQSSICVPTKLTRKCG